VGMDARAGVVTARWAVWMARCRVGFLAVTAMAAMLVWAQPALGACGSWQVVPSARARGELTGVSASSASDAWAVGLSGRIRPMAEHWDGSAWTRVVVPPGVGRLIGVAAISPTDAWAVGQFGVLLHWDGTALRLVKPPSQARRASLFDVTALSATDVWAVGRTDDPARVRILHYNGSAWRVIPGVSPARVRNALVAVSAASPTDVWAVGVFGQDKPLVEHWDGHAWRRVGTPDATRRFHILEGVVAVSVNDVWAVGLRIAAGGVGPTRELIEHWDGSAWTITPTNGPAALFDVAASGASDAWAVGHRNATPAAIDGWDGMTWTPTPANAGPRTTLNSISNIPGTTTYWAVGGHHTLAPSETPLIESRC
jgi:hypothetical protein